MADKVAEYEPNRCRNVVTRASSFRSSLLIALIYSALPLSAQLHFVDASSESGLLVEHSVSQDVAGQEVVIATAGVAVADYDRDGDLDLFVVSGNTSPDLLFRNRGNGVFDEVGALAGIPQGHSLTSGPVFVDVNGDGWSDLFLGGVAGTQPELLLNNRDGTFSPDPFKGGFLVLGNTISAAAGDLDLDGDFDLVTSHWGIHGTTEEGRVWRNDGSGRFSLVTDAQAGIAAPYQFNDYTFTPNLVDLDGDRLLDIAVAADFGTSQIFLNRGGFEFEVATDPAVITDENGMGAALQDVDGDGDVDWFVSSIWDPDGNPRPWNWGVTGNRFYLNRGDGSFEDATDATQTREGYWGWGSCFVDFDLDGDLDLFHTNGWNHVGAVDFIADPSRLFLNDGSGAFVESAADAGLDDTLQGRGVVCFDADRDGDLDIFVSNNQGPTRFFRNELPQPRSINLVLETSPGRPAFGADAVVHIGSASSRQTLHFSNNYVSHQPPELVFAVPPLESVDEVLVTWPNGDRERFFDLPVSPEPVVLRPRGIVAVPVTASPLLLLAIALGLAGCSFSRR